MVGRSPWTAPDAHVRLPWIYGRVIVIHVKEE